MIRNGAKHFFGVSLGVFLVFDRGVFELDLLDREQMEWFGDRHGGDLGTDLSGKEDSLLDGLGSEIRSVSRDQNIPEHRVLLPALFLSAARRWSRRIPGPQEPRRLRRHPLKVP